MSGIQLSAKPAMNDTPAGRSGTAEMPESVTKPSASDPPAGEAQNGTVIADPAVGPRANNAAIDNKAAKTPIEGKNLGNPQPKPEARSSKVYRILEFLNDPTRPERDSASGSVQSSTASARSIMDTKVKATLQKSLFGSTETTLGAVRAKLGITVLPRAQSFCYADGSLVADNVTIGDYLEIGTEEDTKSTADIIYVMPSKGRTTTQILSQPPFVINVFQWSTSPNDATAPPITTSKGSIHSKSLTNPTRAASMTLAGLRKLVSAMSSYSSVHKFCTSSGTTIEDEQLNLAEYLALEPVAASSNTSPASSADSISIPAFKIYYKTNQAFNNPSKVEIPAEIKANTNLTPLPPGKTATIFTEKTRTSLIDERSFMTGADTEYGASYLDDKQWAKVLGNCGVFYGWIVDRRTNRIVRAPKAAFQLRSKILEDPIAKIPDYSPSQEPTVPQSEADKSTGALAGESADSSTELPGKDKDELIGDQVNIVDVQQGMDGLDEATSDTSLQPQAPTQHIPRAKYDPGIPNFRINDDSKIEITACEHEFEVSMARNDFSSQSTESSMSGGFAGFSVSVSAGYASSKSSSSKTTSNTYMKTLVARYLFPRCDLFLYPDDLEPTPELAAAVDRVKLSKNIKDLRKIHTDFGHLFCQNLTLGGRLQSTKVSRSEATSTEQEQKEQFKVSVGISVSTPFGVGGSVKHEEEKSSSKSDSKTEKSTNENNVFEAVGGDTILANNPASWAPTVAKHQYWRVINRDSLAPLADVLAAIPGYHEVKSYFIQAVPAVSKYIELDDSRQVMARFRLMAPLNGLYLNIRNDSAYYLGHMPEYKSTPTARGINQTNFWAGAIEWTTETPLFSPATIRAPVLLGYADNKIGLSEFGKDYTPQYTQTEWNIIAPFSDALTHGARIVLCTNPYTDPATRNKPDAPPNPTPQHMVVFRNQQGVFLPGMSDSDENQYWRILKKNGGVEGEYIKEGDEVRFCWAFSDQVTGFRDYTDDVFGRRRNQCPPELAGSILYLKLPWPRFETATAHSMIMSSMASTEAQAVDLKVRPAKAGAYKYVMQDVSFRIDSVANGGLGDTNDYLLRGADQEGTRVTASWIGSKMIFQSFFF